MKELKRISNLIYITLMVLILMSGAALCVLADDGTADGSTGDVPGISNTDTVPGDEDVDDDIDLDDDDDIDLDNDDDIDLDDDSDDEDIDDNDTNGTDDADDEEGSAIIEPNDDDDNNGVVGEASWCIPVAGGTWYFVEYPDGTVESWFEPNEIIDEGILGAASSYDATTGLITITHPDGRVESYYDNSDSTYTVASTNSSDAYVPFVAEPAAVEEEVKVEETVIDEVVEPVADDYTAVLGDYEEPTSSNIPLTAGLALFSGSVIALGVLWKLSIIAFL